MHIPLIPCCPAQLDCDSPEGERLCMIECIYRDAGNDRVDPRYEVWDAFYGAMECAYNSCYLGSPVDGDDVVEGRGTLRGPPYNGPNWCLDDIQKQIDDTILDLRQAACVQQRCQGPINENCPNKNALLIEICSLEALKRARCDMFQIQQLNRLQRCILLQDYAIDLANLHRKHCYGIPADFNNACPSSSDDVETTSDAELQAFNDCRRNFDREKFRILTRLLSNANKIDELMVDQLKNRYRQYELEVAACGCAGQEGQDDSAFPQLYPQWFEGIRTIRDGDIPYGWGNPLGSWKWQYTEERYEDGTCCVPGLNRRFMRDIQPNWLPFRM